MEFAEQTVEVDVARFLRGDRKGVAQRRRDALPVMREIDENHLTVPPTFTVAAGGRRRVLGHGGFEVHDGITNKGEIGFVFGRFQP